jgi:hypothetical protein
MGWDRGKYYSRSKKVNGRVEREYVGKGELAELLAQIDAAERDRREAERETQSWVDGGGSRRTSELPR